MAYYSKGLNRANDTMTRVADMQVSIAGIQLMTVAPEEMKNNCFAELFDSKINSLAKKGKAKIGTS